MAESIMLGYERLYDNNLQEAPVSRGLWEACQGKKSQMELIIVILGVELCSWYGNDKISKVIGPQLISD